MYVKNLLLLIAAVVPLSAVSAESVDEVAARQAAEEAKKFEVTNPVPVVRSQSYRSSDGVLGIGGYGSHLLADITYNGTTLTVKRGDSLPGGGNWRVHEITATSVTLAVTNKKGRVLKSRELNFLGNGVAQVQGTGQALPSPGPSFVPEITTIAR